MAVPEARTRITAQDETGPAFSSAAANARKYASQTESALATIKDSTKGVRDALTFTNAAIGGFGAVQLVEKFARITQAVVESALGLGDWVIEAEKAGAVISADILADAQELSGEVRALKTAFMEMGAEIAGVVMDDIKSAVGALKDFVKEHKEMLRSFVSFAADIARTSTSTMAEILKTSGLPKLLTPQRPLTAEEIQANRAQRRDEQLGRLSGLNLGPDPLAGIQVAGVGAGDRLPELTDDEGGVLDELAPPKEMAAANAKAARDQERKAAELRRHTEHLAKIQSETSLFYDQQEIAAAARETQKIERERLHALQVMEQFTTTNAERLAAIESWEQREIALVGSSEAAKERIHREANRRRREEGKRDSKERLDREKTSLTATVNLLSGAFGQTKGIRIAEALVNTYTGVTAALAKGPAGIAPAALILAQGLKQVSAIKSADPGSSGGGGGGLGGIGGGGGDLGGGLAPPAQLEQPTRVEPRGKVEIHVVGNVMTPEFTRDYLLPEIRKATRDNFDVGIYDERGRPRSRAG